MKKQCSNCTNAIYCSRCAVQICVPTTTRLPKSKVHSIVDYMQQIEDRRSGERWYHSHLLVHKYGGKWMQCYGPNYYISNTQNICYDCMGKSVKKRRVLGGSNFGLKKRRLL